jgi:hypothetical protein
VFCLKIFDFSRCETSVTIMGLYPVKMGHYVVNKKKKLLLRVIYFPALSQGFAKSQNARFLDNVQYYLFSKNR